MTQAESTKDTAVEPRMNAVTNDHISPEPSLSVYSSQAEAQQIGSLDVAETALIRARQDSRSRVLGVLLIGMCVLFFAITVVKIGFLS